MGTANSKEEFGDKQNLVEELKAGFAQWIEFSKSVKNNRLWKKDSFFYYALNRIARKRVAEKLQMRFEAQKKRLDPDKETDLILRDLKTRQLRLSLIPTSDLELEVLHEMKKNSTEFYKELEQHCEGNASPQKIFDYYFNIPKREKGQSEAQYMEDSFLIRQTRTNMILRGKSDEEIDKQVKELKAWWENSNTKFVVKMVLAPCGALSPALKVGFAFARMLNLPSTSFGNNHAAIQVGPYLIGWFDDSVVHIDLISSSKAMLCLYPSDNISRCFIDRPAANENLNSSSFGKICSTIAQWNLNRRYNKLTANCQVFFYNIFPLPKFAFTWKSNYATKLFVEGVMNQEVNPMRPFTLWLRPRGTWRLFLNVLTFEADNKEGEYVRTDFESYEEFIAWCRENIRTSYEYLNDFGKEYYFICHSIERCYLLRMERRGGDLSNLKPYFKANGEVNHIGLTIFEKIMQ